jgi:aldehyde:ferredoxin oxidoreductase
MGRIAYVDLSRKDALISEISEELRHLYLGGRGINMYLLYNHVAPDLDPLGPDNVLVFGAGLLNGTAAPSSGRFNVSAKSPLTGLLGDSNCGGFWAPQLRFASFDHLVIEGKASEPVYLWINDGRVEFRDASHLWGMDTIETQAVIKEELGDPKVQVVCIGQAGENLVRFACVRHNYKQSAGRTGMGAVMGSKNLKAIAVRGKERVEVRHPRRLLQLRRSAYDDMSKRKIFGIMTTYGTSFLVDAHQLLGNMCVKNNQRNQIEEELWGPLSIESLKRYSFKMNACFGCFMPCRHSYYVPYGPYEGAYAEGPENFAIKKLGVGLANYDMESVLVAQDMCNRYGLDTTDTGGLIGWLMELYQRGIIDESTSDGLLLEWGNKAAMFDLIDRIAYRQGLGDILAEGGLRAAEKIGANSVDYFMHVKGITSEAEERGLKGCALNMATASRGADHLRSRPIPEGMFLPADVLRDIYGDSVSPDPQSYEGKARMVAESERWFTVPDMLGMCKFSARGFMSPKHYLGCEDYTEFANAVTGLDMTPQQMLEIAERVITLERMFNLREGMRREDDTLPKRFFEERSTSFGPLGGQIIDRAMFGQMLDEFYELHGCDREGVPTGETLDRLGLSREPSHLS